MPPNSVNICGRESFGRPECFHVDNSPGEMAKDQFEFDPRKMGAKADMLANAEGEMAIRTAIESQREGGFEEVFVTIRRRIEQCEGVPGANGRAADLYVMD